MWTSIIIVFAILNHALYFHLFYIQSFDLLLPLTGTTTNAVVAAKVEKAAAAIITETPYEWLNCKLLPLQNKSTFSWLFAKSCSGRSRCGGVQSEEFYICSLSRGSSLICRAELAAYVQTSGLNARMHADSCVLVNAQFLNATVKVIKADLCGV